MRIYVPATSSTVDKLVAQYGPAGPVLVSVPAGSVVFLVDEATAAQARAEHSDVLEELEFIALYGAADWSLNLIADSNDSLQRAVLTLDVNLSDGVLDVPEDELRVQLGELASYARVTRKEIAAAHLVCVHVDEPEASNIVAGVIAGDAQADEALQDQDLLWFDATEIFDLPR